jgi:hypothetical protein
MGFESLVRGRLKAYEDELRLHTILPLIPMTITQPGSTHHGGHL